MPEAQRIILRQTTASDYIKEKKTSEENSAELSLT
jgi:hypothetical protein